MYFVQQQEGKSVYTENHEAFRRLLIVGGITFVIGLFFGDQLVTSDVFSILRGWFPITMWICGLAAWGMCFGIYPKQYAIYDDGLGIEWWYRRRKFIPFDEIEELEAKSFAGKRNIIVRSSGRDYDFGWNMLAPRRPVLFVERLEESINRRRFRAGNDPIRVIAEEPKKSKQRN